jgi:hypothetical protein
MRFATTSCRRQHSTEQFWTMLIRAMSLHDCARLKTARPQLPCLHFRPRPMLPYVQLCWSVWTDTGAQLQQYCTGWCSQPLALPACLQVLCSFVAAYLRIGLNVLAVHAGAAVAVRVVGKAVAVQLQALALFAVTGTHAAPVARNHSVAQGSSARPASDLRRIRRLQAVAKGARLACKTLDEPGNSSCPVTKSRSKLGSVCLLQGALLWQPMKKT